jgi:hypothetical protein
MPCSREAWRHFKRASKGLLCFGMLPDTAEQIPEIDQGARVIRRSRETRPESRFGGGQITTITLGEGDEMECGGVARLTLKQLPAKRDALIQAPGPQEVCRLLQDRIHAEPIRLGGRSKTTKKKAGGAGLHSTKGADGGRSACPSRAQNCTVAPTNQY